MWNWTAITPNEILGEPLSSTANLSVGYHCLNVTSSDSDGFIDFELACLKSNISPVVTNGNNTGGNNSQFAYGGHFDGNYCFSFNESILFYLEIAVPGGTDIEIHWQVTNIDGDLVAFDVETLFLDASGEFVSNLSIIPTDGSSFFEAGVYTLFVNLIYSSNQSNVFSDSPYYHSFEVECGVIIHLRER